MPDDAFNHRKGLTFEQAEGAAPLPAQLKLKELTPELRAVLWEAVHDSLVGHRDHEKFTGRAYPADPWGRILRHILVYRDHRMADDFRNDSEPHVRAIKQIFQGGDYLAVFGWLQAALRLGAPQRFKERIDAVLKYGRAAYRVLDGDTIVPVGSEAELETIKRAYADLAAAEFHGARAHLRNAAELLTTGKWADSIRESIHAVESVARLLEPSGDFSKRWRASKPLPRSMVP
jgi:hypothetical protein